MELILENVRCFVKRQQVPIRPLTLLVGENSSGKSTFLASLAICSETIGFPTKPRLNVAPYSFGNYDTMATIGKNGKHAKYISLGFITKTADISQKLVATYVRNKGHVSLENIDVSGDKLNFSVSFADRDSGIGTLESDLLKMPIIIEGNDFINLSESHHLASFLFYLAITIADNMEEKQAAKDIVTSLHYIPSEPTYSIAPIRSQAARTYDKLTDVAQPTGDHVPLLLAKLLSGKGKGGHEQLHRIIKSFGLESGLFDDISVKNFGNAEADPFQIMIDKNKQSTNIIDVGYGVSQSLPIVVDSLFTDDSKYILMQQPEVHLHPKAQAALGTFFVDLVTNQQKKFVIETHSDYIIDRVRQEVANKKIKKEDVGILYFDKQGYETTIHQIELDDLGNIVNPPPGYRQFFLDEQMNLLSRGKNR